MTVTAYFWPAPPKISIERTGASLTLSWPTNATSYVLEAAGDVIAGPWSPVPGVTTNSITVPINSSNQFFRLTSTANQALSKRPLKRPPGSAVELGDAPSPDLGPGQGLGLLDVR